MLNVFRDEPSGSAEIPANVFCEFFSAVVTFLGAFGDNIRTDGALGRRNFVRVRLKYAGFLFDCEFRSSRLDAPFGIEPSIEAIELVSLSNNGRCELRRRAE